jgi:pimeloyl-ACP methyl ester carboxylesterase
MKFISETADNGVLERTFELSVHGERVTGVVWTAVGASSGLPAVLMGHGGGQHKKAPGVAVRAHTFVTTLEIAVIAIDAPGHGDRPASEQLQQFAQMLRRKMANAEPVALDVAGENARQALQVVPEWRATLDALQALKVLGADKPVGYAGISMGGAIGVQLVAAEPRITAAVLGLIGLLPEDDVQAAAAARIQVPVEYVMQWNDELVSRESSFALFDALGTRDKSLHAHPGGHMARLPESEIESWQRFFRRHLLA